MRNQFLPQFPFKNGKKLWFTEINVLKLWAFLYDLIKSIDFSDELK